MLTNHHITRILREISLMLDHHYEPESLRFVEVNNRSYALDEIREFKRDLFEAANKIQLMMLMYQLSPENFQVFTGQEEQYLLAFHKDKKSITPVIIHPAGKKRMQTIIKPSGTTTEEFNYEADWYTNEAGEILFFVIFEHSSIVSDFGLDETAGGKELSPVNRLFRLLHTERNQINYIFFYAIITGLISLVLPLGIQATVELISGGVFFSSVYVLIAIVIIGVTLGGILQIMQITLVEHLQRRVFAKASLEFAYRIPRLKAESIISNYAPELVNRFFDIMTIQKGMPKLLIDFTSGVVQIFFGLLLLSLYHPFFVFFSIGLVTILVVIFYLTGPRGLKSSISESKYKYKVAQWLEELARAINSFKLAGSTDLPIKKTDYYVHDYLKYRKTHFQVLISQFSSILLFKALVTGGLLIVGTILVVDRQITLGQFVASEVIIILLLASVEKIIMYMDVIYDLLTAVDKIAQITDIPLEKVGGLDFPSHHKPLGYSVQVKNLKYKYPNHDDYTLRGINLSVEAGEHVCISGPGGVGKTTLMNVISGIYSGFEGVVTINDYSIRDLDLTHLRDKIGKNISQEDIFDGSILDNITVGKPMEDVNDAVRALRMVGLADEIHSLPEGLNTHLTSGGKNLSNTAIHKLILARCLAKSPELIILNDFFNGLKRSAKIELINCLVDKNNRWTLIAVSNDPLVMAACDRVVIMNEGVIEAEGKFEDLLKSDIITRYID
ncbi:MAG: ATP-binding cassette domain-containing protein [Cyclobacteriaceae bacterium]|jgi:ABC-type bacteriocin/lantibiotic exporter with double-glycine peptidase domain|nr:ATP-binding cassette domain-containing protein [Cyclobacteriaceae bacterium]